MWYDKITTWILKEKHGDEQESNLVHTARKPAHGQLSYRDHDNNLLCYLFIFCLSVVMLI